MINGLINGQVLALQHPTIVSDTIDYLEVDFHFQTEDWSGMSKWAHFTKDDESYKIALINDRITKKHHLNLGYGIWDVFLHGESQDGTRITTTTYQLRVRKSGVLDGSPLPEIPLSEAEQIDLKAQNALDTANEAMKKAEQAGPNAERAETAANAAEQSERNALESSNRAKRSEISAKLDADRAEQAAGQSGYMSFEIDDNGDLIYTKTANVVVNFELINGELIVHG